MLVPSNSFLDLLMERPNFGIFETPLRLPQLGLDLELPNAGPFASEIALAAMTG